ncbi:S8 family serine peptidase [Microbacterium hominis]|uniref:S8 family serine peptidase n=1 Tax=Microbacterium hominis TaxID=162426 RepID=A0A7D4TPX9_9MICO|nr:S8 family serine peptidase [Microbacterium hominis]QKJ20762.1 S8 family serine peptidase [Microbacterium hominis]
MRYRVNKAGAAMAVVGIISVATAATAPAVAAPPPPTAASGGWVTTSPQRTVTLITGDEVTLHDGPGDAPIVEFTAAPRETGAPISYAAYGDAEHYYVIPSDVAGLVPDKLDLGLFDVLTLAELDDAEGVPVIVQSDESTNAKTHAAEWEALDVDADRTLESIDAVSGEVPAAGAPALLEAVDAGGSVQKVWLDAPVEMLDAVSTPQIGAPAAWEAGLDGTGAVVAVLDTGIDTTHPDLDEGVVIKEKDFTGSGSTKDPFGHGTHVASIVAGSGEASDGANRGVAYGAKLLNARVLGPTGFGQESWTIDAMEWAAAEGADVINMSLGVRGDYTDGTDPGALAVDSISERYDTLVVVAAGNEGNAGSTTVTTPGTAQSALTVGAIDENDQLAGFSSVGPRFGDAGVKPDVTAPGAWILAARAAGTRPDIPAEDKYVHDGGTSMATPAVAGAAAILKAARPDLDGDGLKAVLMGTAQSTVGDVWKEGAGKIQIPAALGQPLYAEPSSLSIGVFESPREEQVPRTVSIEYTNTQATDLTLELWDVAAGSDGAPVPDGMITLSSTSVTVPAHGTASVDVTVDPTLDDPDFYTGVVTAAGAGFVPVRTVLGFQVEADMAALHLEALQPDGALVRGSSYATLYNIDDPSIVRTVVISGGKADVRVPIGRYAILGALYNSAPDALIIDGSTLFTRDLDLTEPGRHDVVIDGTKAMPVSISTEKQAQVTNFDQVLKRTLPGWSWPVTQSTFANSIISSPGVADEIYVFTEGDLVGEQTLTESWLLAAPELDVAVTSGSRSIDLALDLRYAVTSPELTGSVNAGIVAAGAGTPAELERAGVRGKVALVEARPAAVGTVTGLLNAQAQAAKDAGALALIAYGPVDGPYWEDLEIIAMGNFPDKVLPTLTLPRATGLQVLDLLAAKKGAKLVGTGYGYAPYDYAFATVEHGIPASLDYRLDASNTAVVTSAVNGQTAGSSLQEWHTMITAESYVGFPRWLDEPVADRTISYLADAGVRFQRSAEPYAGGGTNGSDAFPSAFNGPLRSYAPGEKLTEELLGQVVHGGLYPDPESPSQASVRRDGDVLAVDLPYRVDAQGHPNVAGPDGGTDSRMELWIDGTPVTSSPYASGSGAFPADEHTYRLALETHRYERWWTQSTDVRTEWTFRSAATDAPTVLPLLQLDYGVQGLSSLNVASSKRIVLTPTVSHQDGSTGSTIQGLKLWASFDAGKSWTAVAVSGSDGDYSATITPPKGTTKVALKSEAWDAAGGTFTETVIDAIAVK